MIFPLIIIGKFVSCFSRFLNLGSGGTWPGEIALFFNSGIFSYFISQVTRGIILVAGTNGKTTTAKMIQQILVESGCDGRKIVHNDSGANLLNGLVSAFIQKSSLLGKIDVEWAVLEVDEATVPRVVSSIKYQVLSIKKRKYILVFLDLFRDQLDRYGEVDLIASKWKKTLADLPEDVTVILNADDPQVAYLGKGLHRKVVYFGIDKPEKFLPSFEHATDSIYCRQCGAKLEYKGVYFSHIGIWYCPQCSNKRPRIDITNWVSPLPGIYNEYNTLAAVAVGRELNLEDLLIKKALDGFTPAFGRQEEFEIEGKKIKIFLSKNPAGFNASLRTVLEFRPKVLLLVLNDRIPDGRDVSWIWDVDFEMIPDNVPIIVSGDRVYDLAVRVKYSRLLENQKSKIKNQKYPFNKLRILSISKDNSKFKIFQNLKEAISNGINMIKEGETLYILPTYSAMLEVRKILTGRKIL